MNIQKSSSQVSTVFSTTLNTDDGYRTALLQPTTHSAYTDDFFSGVNQTDQKEGLFSVSSNNNTYGSWQMGGGRGGAAIAPQPIPPPLGLRLWLLSNTFCSKLLCMQTSLALPGALICH